MGAQSHFIKADNSKYRRIGIHTIWAEGVSSTAHKTASKPCCGVVWSPVIFLARKEIVGSLSLGRSKEAGLGHYKEHSEVG